MPTSTMKANFDNGVLTVYVPKIEAGEAAEDQDRGVSLTDDHSAR